MSEQIKIVDNVSIYPSHDYVVVRVDGENLLESTSGGIIIPFEVARNKKTETGVVVAVGPGRVAQGTGVFVPMRTKVGDRVIYATYIGYPVRLGKKGHHVVIKDYDVMGSIDEQSHMVDAEDLVTTEIACDAS